MRDHYHPARLDKEQMALSEASKPREVVDGSISLPHILGLSASLVMKSNLQALR